MDLTKLKRIIGQCNDHGELRHLAQAVRDRQRAIEKREWSERKDAAWQRLRGAAVGADMWCHATGTFVGGGIQRGDHATIHSVQPRAKRVWLTLDNGKLLGCDLAGLARYDWRPERCDNPLSDAARKDAEAIGDAFAEMVS